MYSTSIYTEKIIKFPKLISLILESEHDDMRKKCHKIIDFSSLEKLEYYYGPIPYILYFNKTSLQNIYLDRISTETDMTKYIKIMEKIVSFETLKIFNFQFDDFDYDYFKEIQGENYSLTTLEVDFVYFNKLYNNSDCILFDLQKKFPNASNIIIRVFARGLKYENPILIIKENENCKTKRIQIKLDHFMKSLNLYCQCFENIVELGIDLNYFPETKICLKKFFIIFDKNNKIIFRALKIFSYIDNFDENPPNTELNSINFNCMPNLCDLTIICRRLTLNFSDFKKAIEKILLLNIRNIELRISPFEEKNYTFSQLKELFPNINFNKYANVKIEKYLDSR